MSQKPSFHYFLTLILGDSLNAFVRVSDNFISTVYSSISSSSRHFNIYKNIFFTWCQKCSKYILRPKSKQNFLFHVAANRGRQNWSDPLAATLSLVKFRKYNFYYVQNIIKYISPLIYINKISQDVIPHSLSSNFTGNIVATKLTFLNIL